MANKNLNAAQRAKKDEFYTQYYDIESEMEAYLDYNPDVFRGKTVLMPCDDPEWSNFTRYFAQNFESLGLRKLISTSYAIESKVYKYGYQQSLFETESLKFDKDKTKTHGKIFVLTDDITGDGRIDLDDLQWDYLEGDGDFRSEEVRRLRDEADVIVTNPPFSLFREFFAWIMEANKKFVIVANKNCTTYKEVFPYIMENKIWIGYHKMGQDMLFDVPKEMAQEYLENEKEGSKYRIVDSVVKGRSASCWFTNIEHGRRHQPLRLLTQQENIKYSKHKEIQGKGYPKYDNYDAIEVNFYDAIPSDYEGMMGVSITYLDKYCPEQFEIVGMAKRGAGDPALRSKVYTKNDYPNYSDLNATPTLMDDDGKLRNTYPRVLIRKKK